MRINVGGKLWLAFFCTLTFTVLTMYLLLHSSLKRSFLDYTSLQAAQRLEIFQDALVKVYREEGAFTKLTQSPQRWLELKSIIFSDSTPVESQPSTSLSNANSPHKFYREFVSSISLFGPDQNLLMGVLKPGKSISYIPIVNQNTIIGFVGFVKPKVVVREVDRKFMTHQLRFFGVLSLVVLAVSIGVATLLTRRISLPIKALSNHTEVLASGDYRHRIDVNSQDEIGQLGENFNKLAQALEANEKSRANWIADISHEMRTPVAVLKAQIEAMQDGIRPLDMKGLALLQQKVMGLNALVDDLFELTLSDIGALSYQKRSLALDELVAGNVEQYQVKAKAAGLQLGFTSSVNSPVKIDGDSKRLDQLLDNLLENAIRYTDSGGRIEVSLMESDDSVTLFVSDSAPTVPLDQRDKIFERMYRLEGSRNRNTGGAGLGLAICTNIITAHQGTILAEDSPLGGLSLRVELPKKSRQ